MIFRSADCLKFLISMREFLGSNSMMAYLTMMAPRLIELHRVLKKTGIIFLHCDPSSSHYLKLLLDAVFEPSNFRNEIVWCYRQGGRGKKTFARKHDVLFFYSKSKNYKFYVDVVRIPYNGTGGFVTNNNGNVVRGKRYKPHPLGKIPKIGGIYLLLHLLLLEGANELARTNRYQFQLWALNLLGISSGKKGADGGIDGIRYFETGVSGELAKCIAQVKSGKISEIGRASCRERV